MNNFIFDINKCVGCQACVLACSIENKTELPVLWRTVNTFNKFKYSSVPVFQHSLACNHCEEALCMKNCPTLAYSRNEITGAIIHNPEKCLGCKYCTWACPYDAPKFNNKTHIIEKCNFCNPRIEKGLLPACVNLCPTGALNFETENSNISNKSILGFSEIGIKPRIKIIPLRNENPPVLCKSEIDIEKEKNFSLENIISEKKISAKKEIPLIIFTLLASLLTSFYGSKVFGGFSINITEFLILGISGMILSSLHLGRKLRAYRSIFNIKNSWLSREIFFFSAFIFGVAFNEFIFSDNKIISYIVALTGLLALFSIDMVYKVAVQKTKINVNSSSVFLTGILFCGILTQNYFIYLIIMVLKSGLYIYKNYYDFRNSKISFQIILKYFRLILLIIFSLVMVFSESGTLFWISFSAILLSEIIDRIEFYNELQILTPEIQMDIDLKENEIY
jgi:Fe-S-cluster-containing dehydrogenase component/DMSO reductase anchor subunit